MILKARSYASRLCSLPRAYRSEKVKKFVIDPTRVDSGSTDLLNVVALLNDYEPKKKSPPRIHKIRNPLRERKRNRFQTHASRRISIPLFGTLPNSRTREILV